MGLAKLLAAAVSAGLNAVLYVVVGYIGYRIFKSLG
jgi:hypothetical protein